MSCQEITMRKLLNQKYEEYTPNLNPFSNMLFSENWSWPQVHIPQTIGTKTKQIPTKAASVKADIVNWFLALSHNQKCASTTVHNPNFLYKFLETYHSWNPSQLYHIYQHRKIPNYLNKNTDPDATKDILSYLSIAWFDQPLIYFSVDPLESENFFRNFLTWIDRVSNNKVFEYAHKIKNKSDPQENILWFTQKSFQSLEAWIINEFEKVLIKNYYNKNNYDLENYSKIVKLRAGLANNWNNSFGCKKELQLLLCTKIAQTKNKAEADFKEYQQKIKNYEDQYYEQANLLMDYEKEDENCQRNQENLKKKKKKPKKRNKKKPVGNSPNSNQKQAKNDREQAEVEAQIEIGSPSKSQKQENEDPTITSLQYLKDPEDTKEEAISINFELANKQNQILSLGAEKQIPSPDTEQNNPQQTNPKVQQQYQQKSDYQNSEHSEDWSNVETTKTTKKSGHSHPQFNQSTRINHLKAKRSLSPQQNNKSISKLKRKQRGERKNKVNQISSWNGDESLNQNFMESYEGKQHSNKQQIGQKYTNSNYHDQCNSNQNFNNDEQIQNKSQQIGSKQKLNTEMDQTQQCQKKKKKKVSKTTTLLKQLSNKVSTSLLNRQLNNFIDSLSIQTNNLYDHKIISFERVRFFIQSLFPSSQAILFGSNAVGLSLPTSDIDIMLFNLPCSCRQEAIQILAHLAVQINTMGWILSCSTYLNAKVPLVKLQIDPTIEYTKTKRKCDYLGLMYDPRMIQHLEIKNKKEKDNKNANSSNNIIKVDLTINITEESIMGGQSTELMKQWMNRYPQIHMCILAFKYILAQRGFSSNFKGGIGSYCLFVMVAAYIREYPQLEALEDGQFFLSTLKFYGEDFENQIKSIILRPFEQPQSFPFDTCFISLQQTLSLIHHQSYQYQMPMEDPTLLYNIQTNPLRIFDPINSRIMSGSCQMYPQIKAEFRRIYKELKEMKEIVEKEIELTVNGTEIGKMLENKKTMDKWLNKYEARNRVSVKDVLDGGF